MDLNIDDEWKSFLLKMRSGDSSETPIVKKEALLSDLVAPICGDLNISTTTKVLFINQPVQINDVFWNIPIMRYGDACDGNNQKTNENCVAYTR